MWCHISAIMLSIIASITVSFDVNTLHLRERVSHAGSHGVYILVYEARSAVPSGGTFGVDARVLSCLFLSEQHVLQPTIPPPPPIQTSKRKSPLPWSRLFNSNFQHPRCGKCEPSCKFVSCRMIHVDLGNSAERQIIFSIYNVHRI